MYGIHSKRDMEMEYQSQVPILRPSIHARRAKITVKFQDLYGFTVEGNVDDVNVLNEVREKVREQGKVWWSLEASKGANWYLQTHVSSTLKTSLKFSALVNAITLKKLIRKGIPPVLWTTINEPNMFAEMAYVRGVYPPARCSPPFGNCSAGNSDTEPLVAMHNMLLAHAKAAKLYREHFQPKQGGMIGIVVHSFMYKPLRNNDFDRDAAHRAVLFTAAWVFDPLVHGDYPPEMRNYLADALPRFTSDERKLIKDSIDFMGINHYGTLYAKDCIYSSCVCSNSSCIAGGDHPIHGYLISLGEKDGVSIGEPTGMSRFFVVPNGMEEIVDYMKKRYHNKPMFVTENGYASLNPTTAQADELQHDTKRVEFHKSYLASLARAIRKGADVRGYFIWSLMDNFEWTSGYELKFGLYYVDRDTLDRVPKLSAKWYTDFLTNKSLNAEKKENFITFKYTTQPNHTSDK